MMRRRCTCRTVSHVSHTASVSSGVLPKEHGPHWRLARLCDPTVRAAYVRGLEGLDVLGCEALAANAPCAAGEFLNPHPGDAPHGLALDRHHGVGDLLDHLSLLIRREDAFNELNVDEWHVRSPVPWSVLPQGIRSRQHSRTRSCSGKLAGEEEGFGRFAGGVLIFSVPCVLHGGQAMIYVFDAFELDPGQVELRRNGVLVHVEPQVFALLVLLVENRERMVSRDEIIEKV